MSELPEVEMLKRYLESTALHRKIEKIEVNSDRVLKEISSRKINHELKGHAFEHTRRHSKFMFARIDGGGWLALHFGMTGDLKYYKGEDKRPEYALVEFDFSNGYHLAYVMTRKLGEVRVIGDVYSDEILYQARIHPETSVDDLNEEDLKQIYEKMNYILNTAIEQQAIPDRYPDCFITKHRDEDEKCPNCDGEVERLRVSGRSAYYCPSCRGR